MAWSFSRLQAFETCPRQYYELKVAKNFQELSHPTTVWGTRGHEALELFVRDGAPLPSEFGYLTSFAKLLQDMPGITYCEHELACTRDYAPTDFDADDAWARGIIDLFKFKDDEAIAIDYKFGKVKPSSQLKLMALLIFANYPTVKKVTSRFLWIAHREVTSGEYYRKDAPALWGEFLDRAAQFAEAADLGQYPEKSSGLCKAHCPVSTCQFYQRGGRR